MIRGSKHTTESRMKLSKSHRGQRVSIKTEFKKGLIPWNKGLKGIQVAWNRGIVCSEETKRKISNHHKGKPLGLRIRRIEQECKHCHNIFIKRESDKKEFCNKKCWYNFAEKPISKQKGKPRFFMRGENNWRWIADRMLLKDDHKDRGGSLSRDWGKRVKDRDGWRCRVSNENCEGRMEAHHILGWLSYPELRYELNNGITLCHAHHPRKRAEERKSIPIFQGMISQSEQFCLLP